MNAVSRKLSGLPSPSTIPSFCRAPSVGSSFCGAGSAGIHVRLPLHLLSGREVREDKPAMKRTETTDRRSLEPEPRAAHVGPEVSFSLHPTRSFHTLSARDNNSLHVVHAVALEDFATNQPHAEPELVRMQPAADTQGKQLASLFCIRFLAGRAVVAGINR